MEQEQEKEKEKEKENENEPILETKFPPNSTLQQKKEILSTKGLTKHEIDYFVLMDPNLSQRTLKWMLDFAYGRRLLKDGMEEYENLPSELVTNFVTNMLEMTQSRGSNSHSSYPSQQTASDSLTPKENSTQTTQSTQTTAVSINLPKKEGFLKKKGEKGLINLWRDRYFVLRNRKLYYYKSKEEEKLGSYTGYVTLNGSVVRESEEIPNGFVIITTIRTWQFKAAFHKEQQEWISAIYLHCQANTDSTVSLELTQVQ